MTRQLLHQLINQKTEKIRIPLNKNSAAICRILQYEGYIAAIKINKSKTSITLTARTTELTSKAIHSATIGNLSVRPSTYQIKPQKGPKQLSLLMVNRVNRTLSERIIHLR